MSLSLLDIQFLTSSTGARLMDRLAAEDLSEAAMLTLVTRLRKDFTADQTRAGLEMARLRHKAVEKFGTEASHMWFTRDALEQASDPLVRHYRAGQIGAMRVIDACCGIGADSLALAANGCVVLGIDQDALRIEIARLNANALNLNAQFQLGDVRVNMPDADYVFFDPARRDEHGRRIYDVEHYLPPLSTIRAWKQSRIAVKLSPGVDLTQLAPYAGRVEFISVDGDLKESVLWYGDTTSPLTATLLTTDQTYIWHSNPIDYIDAPRLSDPQSWLIEPDSALLRAGLVQAAAARFNGVLLDETIAYFTTTYKPDSPWLRAWAIEAWMPFNLKRLRTYLRQHNIGHVTVKKRGTAVTPDTLIPQLRLKGDVSRVLILTRCKGQQIVMICADYTE